MRRILFFATLLIITTAQAQNKVTLSQNGRETTMSNGLLNVVIDQYGRVKTLNYEGSENLLGDATKSIYFDFTRKVDGKSVTLREGENTIRVTSGKLTDEYRCTLNSSAKREQSSNEERLDESVN